VGGGCGQWRGERAVPPASGGARGDVRAAWEGDTRVGDVSREGVCVGREGGRAGEVSGCVCFSV
jgi:hypothetical protein